MKKLFILLAMLLSAISASAQYTAIKGANGKWGFCDKSSKWVITAQYEAVDPNNTFTQYKKYAAVKVNGKWGCIDEANQMVTAAVFETSRKAGLAGKEWQAKDPTAKGMYEAFSPRDQKWGFVNCRGNYVIKPQFTAVDDKNIFYTNDNKFALVQKNGAWGAIDKDGYYIVKPYFISKDDALKAVQENIAYAKLGENIYTGVDPSTRKCGFLNYKGNWTVKPNFSNYDKGYTFDNNHAFAVVKYGQSWGCLNRAGKFIVKPSYNNSDAAKKAGFQWQSTYKQVVEASEIPDIDDGKFKECLIINGGNRILANGGSSTNTSGSSNTTYSNVQPPTLRIINPKNGATYTSANVTVDYEAHTFDGSTPKILAYVNGELQQTKGVQRVGKQITLQLPRNTNSNCNIQLIAKDSKGRNSDPAVISLKYVGAEGKPALHIMAVGVSDYDQADLKLQNAAKDATDFVATIKGLNLSQYDRLASTTLITDKNATDKNIKKGLSALNSKVNQGDVVLLFFSGHGAKEDGSTYFLSVNAESNDLFSSSVNFDEIRSATKRLLDKKCRIIVFMDACHSGALYGQKSTAESFALSEPGIIGFYSSTESQKSNESDKWSNGIFTKALLEGLKGKAADTAGDITLDQLEKYIRETVRKSTNGTQMPIFENKQGNYVLFKKQQQ